MDRENNEIIQLKVRMKEYLRAQIESSAATNGVSLSAEIVTRVERSFEDERCLIQILGGDVRGLIAIAVSAGIRQMEEMANKAFGADPDFLLKKQIMQIEFLQQLADAHRRRLPDNLDPFLEQGPRLEADKIVRRTLSVWDAATFNEAFPGDNEIHDILQVNRSDSGKAAPKKGRVRA